MLTGIGDVALSEVRGGLPAEPRGVNSAEALTRVRVGSQFSRMFSARVFNSGKYPGDVFSIASNETGILLGDARADSAINLHQP